MNRQVTLIGGIVGGLGAGAALMYFLDPDRGRRRRALVRDKAVASANGMASGIRSLAGLSHDARNRAYGLLAEAKGMLRQEEVPDETLEARIRSRLGHKIEHPGSVEVTADHGCVTLAGHLPAAEVERLVDCVSRVRGVREVANRVALH